MPALRRFRISLLELFGLMGFVSITSAALVSASLLASILYGLAFLLLLVVVVGIAVSAKAHRAPAIAFVIAVALQFQFASTRFEYGFPTRRVFYELAQRLDYAVQEELFEPFADAPSSLTRKERDSFARIGTQATAIVFGIIAALTARAVAPDSKAA